MAIEVAGFKMTVNKSDEVKAALNRSKEKILEAWGILAEGYATEYAPVDTGNLKTSIGHDKDVSQGVAVVGTNVEYAPYQELGTYKMKAHPFLTPAIMDHQKEYKDIAVDYISQAL